MMGASRELAELGSAYNSGGLFGFRNRIINGAMVIDQRNNGAAVTATGAYPVDRWQLNNATDASLSVARSTDVPSGQGFTNSVVVTTPTADASIGAAQYANLQHRIEGFNFADMGFGASGASSITLSFWVKATVSGNYSVAIYNRAENRINPQQFSVSAGGTWEKKTITIAGDTTGTWLTNNGIGANVTFYYALGSNFLGSSGWNSGGTYGVSGQSNALASNSNTFAITGVQLEKGSTATSFDYRPYGTELALCQRYYQIAGNGAIGIFNSATTARFLFTFPVWMRAAPTVTAIAAPTIINPLVSDAQTGSQTTDFGLVTGSNVTQNALAKIQFGGFSSGADSRICGLQNNALALNSEL